MSPAGKDPARPAARLAERMLNEVTMRETISKIGLTAIPGHRAILIFVIGMAFCPLTQADRSVTLAWDPSPDTNVAGYLIHYGNNGTNYTSQTDAGTNTSFSVTGLQAGETNTFVVAAYDVNHNESPPSNPVEYVVPNPAQMVTILANPANAGSVNGGGSFVTGSSVTVTATANGGYAFTNWTENGTVRSTSPSFSFTLATNRNLVAIFTANLTFISPAVPPVLAAVPDQSVNVGSVLFVTNTVTEANGISRQITFSLGAGAPAGTFIYPNGIFRWAPACEQGSTTNLITVWAVDNGIPALSNSVSFNVTVSACVQVTVGSGAVLIGNDTSVPVNLYSTVSLTNVSFSLATLAGGFTNWGVTASNPGMVTATVQASDPSQPQFNFAVQSGHALQGASSLGTISVEALPAGNSRLAPLTINNIVATTSNNILAGPVFGQSGRLVLIAAQPLLEASLTNRSNPVLTLYGNPGSNYMVMSATNLLAPITWTTFTNFTLTTAIQFINPGPLTNQMEFFRALQQ